MLNQKNKPMNEEVKYPIILEKPTTRVVIEFLLKKFGIEINRNDQIFLCQKETCRIDSNVGIAVSDHDPHAENFVCLFFIDKRDGLTPIMSPEKIKEFVTNRTWEASDETLGSLIREHDIRPDFVITFGRLEMPSGVSSTCWCVHEFLSLKEEKNTGVFDALVTVPEIVNMFTNYLWNNMPVLTIGMKGSEEVQLKKGLEISEETIEAEPDPGQIFKMESIFIHVLKGIPLDTKKRLITCFCENREELRKHLPEIPSWDEKRIKTFILKNDVLNAFDEYREEIAEAMTGMMSNEGMVEPNDEID
jgi:hypothetical protein